MTSDSAQKTRMIRTYGVIFVLLLLIGAFWYFFEFNHEIEELKAEGVSPTVTTTPYAITQVTMASTTFQAQIADTEELREEGLSDRSSLPANQIMLFVFPTPSRYGFWMKDMNFALDMIWTDVNGTIIYLKENATPDSYPAIFYPDLPASAVIEANVGTISNLHLQIGDKINFDKNLVQKASN